MSQNQIFSLPSESWPSDFSFRSNKSEDAKPSDFGADSRILVSTLEFRVLHIYSHGLYHKPELKFKLCKEIWIKANQT